MAASPIIQEYMLNPEDPVLKSWAHMEFNTFENELETGIVFWINDLDRIFHITGYEPYFVDADNPDNVILFTGGANAGRHYAAGEVLFNKKDLKTPIEWLPRPILATEPQYPWENCWLIDGKTPSSGWYDTVFFTHLTLHNGTWYAYYGGSEYYTCLATAPYTHRPVK